MPDSTVILSASISVGKTPLMPISPYWYTLLPTTGLMDISIDMISLSVLFVRMDMPADFLSS
jgi:hypothetical protein